MNSFRFGLDEVDLLSSTLDRSKKPHLRTQANSLTELVFLFREFPQLILSTDDVHPLLALFEAEKRVCIEIDDISWTDMLDSLS